jgi:tyrosine-protein phosphatase SIW14
MNICSMYKFLILALLIPAQLHSQNLPHFAVAPTAMNVLYRGLENPIEIAVSCAEDSNTIVQFSNVEQALKKDEKWLVKPGKGASVIVTVSELKDGNIIYVGKKEFRVKNVPDPKPYFGGATGEGSIRWANLTAAPGVIAKMEYFQFDLRFEVLSYEIAVDTGNGEMIFPSIDPRVNPNTEKPFRALRNGGLIEIRSIKAIGPDSAIRELQNIILSVKPRVPYGIETVDIKNKKYVNYNIYRSAQPSKDAMQQLSQVRYNDVLNLRRVNKDNRFAKGSEVQIHHLPIKTRKMKEDDIVQALKIIDDSHYAILVHCKHGADRTGTVIAAYRIIYQDWKKDEAIIEMRNPKFGYHEKLFPKLVELIENLDVEGIRNELGVDQ